MPATPSRRALLGALGLLAIGALPMFQAQAQDYPQRPIRLIVPFLAGAGTDLSARTAAEALAERLGRPVVVENRAGAGGTIGSALVAQAAPDGYTLLWGEAGGVTIQPILRRNPPYAQSDFTYIAKFAETGMAYVVSSDVPVQSIEALQRHAAANPDRLRYGSSGTGTSTQLATVLFLNTIGVRMEHVPYGGVAGMVSDLLAGRIEFGLFTPAAVGALRGSDRIRILGISAPARHPSLPDVPTAREAGIAGAEVTTWYGMLAPAGLPPHIRQRLQDEIAAIAADPAVIERIRRINLEIAPVIGEDFEALVARETEVWRGIIQAEGIVVE
ncbi:Bug family tripartite tricarboxylate transporter substrate binding protein [Falsiroseomonas sp. E2-1-a4]|uniref:Bug family tripartite tricarboxylate transporter substrate binding protein n=1 Tax=Falsiroseomonas sp. E2-1-a4 TaxID=3239299 RepID=UPI003F4138A1